MNKICADLMNDIRKTRYDVSYLVSWMPKTANTKGQKRLQKLHGTPREFAKACLAAIGEISVEEFKTAIMKYKKEWEAA